MKIKCCQNVLLRAVSCILLLFQFSIALFAAQVCNVQFLGIEEYTKSSGEISDISDVISVSLGTLEEYDKKIEKANGKMLLSDITIAKRPNALTPYLMLASLEKKVFPKVIISLEDKDKNLLTRFELENVTVASCDYSACLGGGYDSDYENIKLKCKKMVVLYKNFKSEYKVELVSPK